MKSEHLHTDYFKHAVELARRAYEFIDKKMYLKTNIASGMLVFFCRNINTVILNTTI